MDKDDVIDKVLNLCYRATVGVLLLLVATGVVVVISKWGSGPL